MRWPDSPAWRVACRFGEESQQPILPQLMHMRRCEPAGSRSFRHSSQPAIGFRQRCDSDLIEVAAGGRRHRPVLLSLGQLGADIQSCFSSSRTTSIRTSWEAASGSPVNPSAPDALAGISQAPGELPYDRGVHERAALDPGKLARRRHGRRLPVGEDTDCDSSLGRPCQRARARSRQARRGADEGAGTAARRRSSEAACRTCSGRIPRSDTALPWTIRLGAERSGPWPFARPCVRSSPSW